VWLLKRDSNGRGYDSGDGYGNRYGNGYGYDGESGNGYGDGDGHGHGTGNGYCNYGPDPDHLLPLAALQGGHYVVT
jgi:hypothetical protein